MFINGNLYPKFVQTQFKNKASKLKQIATMKMITTTLLILSFSAITFAQSPVTPHNIEALAAQVTKDQQSYLVSKHVIQDVSEALEGVTITDKFLSVSEELGEVVVANNKSMHTLYVHAFQNKWTNHDNPLHDMIGGEFEYTFSKVKTSEGMDVFKLESKEPFNVNFISRKISMLDDVFLVDIPSLKKLDTNIIVNKLEDGYTFTFVKNNGSNDLHWKFYISDDGFVMFINKYKIYNS